MLKEEAANRLFRTLEFQSLQKHVSDIRTGIIIDNEQISKESTNELIHILKEKYPKKYVTEYGTVSRIVRGADSGVFARYLIASGISNAILIIPADIQETDVRGVYLFGLEIVENEPDRNLQEYCKDNNIILVFLFSVNDYAKYMIQLNQYAPGVRPMRAIHCDDLEYTPSDEEKRKWYNEVK